MLRLGHIVVLSLLTLLLTKTLVAQTPPRRVAIVIGNDGYTESFNPLGNAFRDAAAFAKLLESHGIAVTLRKNLTHAGFKDELQTFAKIAAGADTAIVYYAGHGMEIVEGDDFHNALAPTDAAIDCEASNARRTIRMDEAIAATRGALNRVVVLDACRNNALRVACPPTSSGGKRVFGFSNVAARVARGERLLVAYSTGQKTEALDGPEGENSPFAKALISELSTNPTTNLLPVLNRTIVKVGTATGFRQVPSYAIEGDVPKVCLAGSGCDDTIADEQRSIVRALATNAEQQNSRGFPGNGLLLALEALPDESGGAKRPHDSIAESALLQGLRDNLERVVLGHSGPVGAVGFSADGRLLMTASTDGLRLWDAVTGRLQRQISPAEGFYRAMLSPDGRHVLTVSGLLNANVYTGSLMQSWDAATGELRATSRSETGYVMALAFSPDSRSFVTTTGGGNPSVWDAGTGQLRFEIKMRGAMDDVVFAPDSQTFVTASTDNTARIWDAATGTQRSLLLHGARVRSVAVSADGRLVLTAGGRTAQLWDAATGTRQATLRHTAGVDHVAISATGTTVATIAADNTVHLWDGKGTRFTVLRHDRVVRALAFAPSGEWIATISEDNTARVWNVQDGTQRYVLGHDAAVVAVAYSPDGRTLATASADTTARLWRQETDRRQRTLRHATDVLGVAVSPDGETIATVGSGRGLVWPARGKVRVLDHKSGSDVVRPIFSPDGSLIATAILDKVRIWRTDDGSSVRELAHPPYVGPIAFSPDGRSLVSGGGAFVRLWDLSTGAERFTWTHENNQQVLGAAFSKDGRDVMVTWGDVMRVTEASATKIWDAESGTERLTLRHDKVRASTFSPDGVLIATTSFDHTARLWDRATGASRGVLQHEGEVISLAFSPDGRTLATGTVQTTRLWDVDRGEVRATLPASAGLLGFSPDGRLLVSTDEATARVWDTATGRLRSTHAHQAHIQGLAFAPDSRSFVTASRDKTARVWPLHASTQDLVAHAKTQTPRCLTIEQRRGFGLQLQAPDWCFELGKWPYRANAEWWLDRLRRNDASGRLLKPFKEPIWALATLTSSRTAQVLVEVPAGFVTDFASMPEVFWSSMPSTDVAMCAAIALDWLYWVQVIDGKPINRGAADEIFRQMLDGAVLPEKTAQIVEALSREGDATWVRNTQAKSRGEKRLLRHFPTDASVSWAQWRMQPGTTE